MLKIAVIEDEKELLRNLSLMLEAQDFEVKTARDGMEGLKLIKQFKPDLIICDIMMPGMNGYEVISELNKVSSSIPFIFLTAKAERSDLRRGMELGADDYITKPFTNKELINAIETRLNRIKQIRNPPVTADHQSFRKYTPEDEILLELSNSSMLIRVKKIKLIQVVGHFSQITLADNKHVLLRRSITEWEELLPDELFIRVHRSALININFIYRIEKLPSRLHRVILFDLQKKINISRRYFNILKDKFR